MEAWWHLGAAVIAPYWVAARSDSDESPGECAALGCCCGRRCSALGEDFSVAAAQTVREVFLVQLGAYSGSVFVRFLVGVAVVG